MLGFLIAVATELSTNQSVWSQIAGRYVDRELVEAPLAGGAAVMGFGFVVIALTFATFAPKVFANEDPAARSFGPFTPAAESLNGRAGEWQAGRLCGRHRRGLAAQSLACAPPLPDALSPCFPLPAQPCWASPRCCWLS